VTVELPKPIEIRERYLQIRRATSREVVTVVEILSPSNKRWGKGRDEYQKKRTEIAGATTNLVEIDLLRAGEPFPVLREGALVERAGDSDYRILVSRGWRRHVADLYLVDLREPLPTLPVPLRAEDDEPRVALQPILETVYDGGGFGDLLDYGHEPVPPLSTEDAAWADQLLRDKGLR
jgi:hypothetical protein